MQRRGVAFLLSVFVAGGIRVGAEQKPRDPTTLPEWLHFPPNVAKAAIVRGQDAAKRGKKLEPLLDRVKQTPKWVRGQGSGLEESAVWFYHQDALVLTILAYQKAALYAKDEVLEMYKQAGVDATQLNFGVGLGSLPQVARNNVQQDVRVVKFVLTDDKGNVLTAEGDSSEGKDSPSNHTFSSVSPAPSTDFSTIIVNGSEPVTASGGTAPGRGNGLITSSFQRIQRLPWSEMRSDFQATYFVRFGLYDEEGKCRISREAKELVLHIITENGELTATYRLSAPRRKSESDNTGEKS